MRKHTLLLAAALLVPFSSTALALQEQPAPAASAGDRTADAIVQEYSSLRPPSFESGKQNEPNYIQTYMDQRNKVMERKADLAWELYQKDPKHPRVMPLLNERWQTLTMLGKADKVLAETDQLLKAASDETAKAEILYSRAQAMMMDYSALQRDSAPAMAAAEAFIKAKPDDERGAYLLMRLAQTQPDARQQRQLYQRIADQYKDSRVAGMAKGQLRQADGVGKPFELSFTDALNGKEVSMKDLKGKVVVIDFWATWCGPCIAEIPNMKKLYAEYKDKGVEFIGISLDQPEEQGGLKKLKDYCAQQELTWPQYYQGKGWDSEFSKSWGVNGIPQLFIIDADGLLHSTQARGQLEKLIPELLKKRDEKKVTAATP